MEIFVEYSDPDSESDSTVSAIYPETRTLLHSLGSSNKNVSIVSSPLPSFPAELHHLYSASTRASIEDDPDIHEGRQRTTPHSVGSWPTHIYLEWYPPTTELAVLSTIISQYQVQLRGQIEIHSLLCNNLGVRLPLHR
ncbi:uncharacterized protein CIMG_13347 [Coccidioides immitis RS]|uniref:U6 snRNA phosphodiesterase 1 n=1 Tax=Coccidioides immitis (strain RS) TaxID=246410 RepID=A0A0D8JVI1_COCIM|nr:uncharacterized protein CIMG_13347 [Coccidioides immitis RS]KJF60951.1 hypothetical protein CIMG_13347 [Coccidioides immitis RS]